MAEIRKMHRERGFLDIGYHYVVGLDGTLHYGRPEYMQGAHVRGHNKGSIGVVYVGGLKPGEPADKGFDTRTPEQTRTLIALLKALKRRYPKARVVGHRDLAATQCPGFDVIPWWDKVEKEYADR